MRPSFRTTRCFSLCTRPAILKSFVGTQCPMLVRADYRHGHAKRGHALPDELESQESKFNEQFKAWLADLKTVHDDQDSSFLRSLVPTTEQLPRIATVIHQLTPDIIT